MKAGIINKNQFLILESIQDAKLFCELDAKIKAHQSINFWFGVKLQPSNFQRDPMSYAQHEGEGNNPIAPTMGTMIELTLRSGKDVSLVDYCNIADNLTAGFHQYILSEIQAGKPFRLNKKACGCGIDDLSCFESYQDINELEMHNFMLGGDIAMDFKIKSKIVVLENASWVPTRLVEKFCKLTNNNPEEVQIITSFKQKSILYQEKDFVKFFLDGIANGLETIVCDTTGQDERNISALKKVIEYVASIFPDKTFNAYIDTYNKEIFTTALPNINVVFL